MTDTQSEAFEIDPELEERCRQTREAYKLYERERKNKQYRKQKTTGQHRTFLIPFDLDQKLRDEAKKRQIPISTVAKLCLTTALNLWR